MADKKTNKKVFDVAKPGKGKVDIGSKPMIVGHKSMAADPMMRVDNDSDDKADQIGEKISQTSNITIVPVSDHNDSGDAEKTEGAPEIPVDLAKESNLKSLQMSATIDDHISDEDEKPASDSSAAENEDKTEQSSDDLSDKKEEKNEEENKLDPNAIAMERDDNLQKLIESKTYRLDIKESQASDGWSKKVTITVAAILVGLIGLFVAIDTKTLDIGVDLPFSILD